MRLVLFSLVFLLSGCGKTCHVIDLVDDATDLAKQGCTLVRYRGDDGQVREARVSDRSLGRSVVTGERALSCPR